MKLLNRKVCLIVDNASGHNLVSSNFSNIKINILGTKHDVTYTPM